MYINSGLYVMILCACRRCASTSPWKQRSSDMRTRMSPSRPRRPARRGRRTSVASSRLSSGRLIRVGLLETLFCLTWQNDVKLLFNNTFHVCNVIEILDFTRNIKVLSVRKSANKMLESFKQLNNQIMFCPSLKDISIWVQCTYWKPNIEIQERYF